MRQGTGGGTSSADEFLDAALTWFGDPDPRIGTAREKGERLAKLVAHRRTLLVLDGLEPLQNPPGPQEGRLREPSLQALLLVWGGSGTVSSPHARSIRSPRRRKALGVLLKPPQALPSH
jgi:hypothetical protein